MQEKQKIKWLKVPILQHVKKLAYYLLNSWYKKLFHR